MQYRQKDGFCLKNLSHETTIFIALLCVQIAVWLYAAWRGKGEEFGMCAMLLIPLTLLTYFVAYRMNANIYLVIWTTLLMNIGFWTQCIGGAEFLKKDIGKIGLGFVIAFGLSIAFRYFSDYLSFDKVIFAIIGMQMILIILLAAFGTVVATGAQAAKIQLSLGPLGSIQPLEIVKFLYIFVIATLLCKEELKDKPILRMKREIAAIVYTLFVAGVMIGFSEGGTALIVLVTTVIMIITFGDKRGLVNLFIKIGVLGGGIATLACVLLHKHIPFFDKVYQRLSFLLNPDSGYQSTQLRKGLAMGGLFGPVTDRYLIYIPSQQEDMIFGKIVSSAGIVVGTIIIGVIFLIFREGQVISRWCKDSYYKGLTLGFSVLIMVNSFIHIAVNLCVFPITGLPLPFVSHGFTSMTVCLTMVGFMLVISRGTQGRSIYDEERFERFFERVFKHRRRQSQGKD